jgi:hypothetical protein
MFKHKMGWKEALMAVSGGIILICALGFVLSGCAGTAAGVRYTHHSSIPKYYDLHESNMVGPYLSVPVCGLGRDYSRYCPTVEFGAQWDLRKGPHNRPYGTDPVGTINITQPVYVWK